MYEVVLVMDEEEGIFNSEVNPIFIFENEEKALNILKFLLRQGYIPLIIKSEDE